MNYEKKYKEALKWIKDVYPTFEGALKEDAEHYFPEIRESEDEKIREAIKYAIANSTHEDGILLNGVTENKAIVWVEKENEQKEIDYNEELKKCKANPLYFFDKYVKIKLKEHKVIWSENDEEMFKKALNYLKQSYYSEESVIDWFNSIKKRIKGE